MTYKYLFHYKRYGMLRYLSHLETMKTVERILRRSGIPLRQTEGFHQRMKISFAQALPTGIIDLAGLFVVSSFERLSDEYLKMVNELSPKGLEFAKIEEVEEKFRLSKFVEGYDFELIFTREPNEVPFKTTKVGNVWIAKLYASFNSTVPKSGEYGQFLTVRKRALISGGAN